MRQNGKHDIIYSSPGKKFTTQLSKRVTYQICLGVEFKETKHERTFRYSDKAGEVYTISRNRNFSAAEMTEILIASRIDVDHPKV